MFDSYDRRGLPDKLINALPQESRSLFADETSVGLPFLLDKSIDTRTQISVPTVFYLTEDQRSQFNVDLEAPTPEGQKQLARTYTRFELLQLMLAQCIGQPMIISDIRNGAVVQDIIPRDKSREVADSSHGSTKCFSFHNDMSYLEDELIPDFFALGCIRNIERAATVLADPVAALEIVSANTRQELMKPKYLIRHIYHRDTPSQRLGEKISPVFTDDGEIRLGVDMVATNPEASVALTDFKSALGAVAVECILKSGEILVVPNRGFVHGRNCFVAANNRTERRWLQRINIKNTYHS